MATHNPDQVAAVAAMLLQGRFDAEPHHVRKAVACARLILDVAYADEPVAEAPPAPEGETSAA